MKLQRTHSVIARRRWSALLGSLLILGLTLAACTIGPFRISFPGQATQQPAIVLRWCDQARDVLCVLSFGLEPPGRMVIVLLAAPGLPAELRARAAWNGETASYPCVATNADATLLACEGPLIPLGSSVHLDVSSTDNSAPIASGDFVLNALALPTPRGGRRTAADRCGNDHAPADTYPRRGHGLSQSHPIAKDPSARS